MNPLTPEQFLMGGGGAPSAFTTDDPLGTTVGGPIVEPPTLIEQTDFDSGELLTWDDGRPRMQMVVTVQTDRHDPTRDGDDGRRRFYLKGGNLQQVIRDAVRKTGAAGLEVGGSLYVTRVGQGEPKRKGGKAPWLHTATYTPAAQNFLNKDATPAITAVATPTPTPTATPAPAPAPVAQPTPAGPDLAQFPHLTPEQRAMAQAVNLTADQIRAMFPAPAAPAVNAATFPHLTPEQLAAMQAANLTADQVRAMFPAPAA